jgi:8-oxo-dGTP diphosphatase
MLNIKVETIVRAVIESDGAFLLARTRGFSHTFLPGGHVEGAEGMVRALKRELAEEIGVIVEVGRYLGAVEHLWYDRTSQPHYEINHVFAAMSPELARQRAVRSKEVHLEFCWVVPDAVRVFDLQPLPVRELLTSVEREKSWWRSTLDS